ncbi:hypothetical protein [Campylobacter corcagiensis]|uniref:Uncharacterized protein n=1 Tax=Campylobacter corcagiensis TaxID=1448857 RepID=A0A7M1LGM5_9BACT|nr:hypothetical protein [Campylobacter corcagiensis]QKF64340.1 putative membrane protein [Campylobacter corcagiensis]QOQ87471.1 hypothetical protein IMC76_01225 [Campylobacter corcagiensis]
MRVILFLIFILAILVFLSISEDKLNKKMKLGVVGILVLFLAIFYIYESSAKKDIENAKDLSMSFLQGENLKCNGVDVNSTNFIYLEKMDSFLARQGASEKFIGLQFSIDECKK